jgi:metallo-beta-lactamase family protein
MDVTFLGAARTVTGSMHLVTAGERRVLLDCGLFQGPRREAFARNRELPFDPTTLDAIVLSHAHIDHSGALPMASRGGFAGTVYATPATRDLAAVMLRDAALIQASDARHVNQLIDRGELEGDRVEPIYSTDDVDALLRAMIGVPYHRPIAVAPGIRATFVDAGHVLGSAAIVLDVDEAGHTTRLVFSGDVGRAHGTILRPPEIADAADALLLESTYGDRVHPARPAMDDGLADAITRTIARGGKVIIPTFALERAQDLVVTLKRLVAQGRIPTVPMFVDSPLTVQVTDVFRMHPECCDASLRAMLDRGDSPFDVPGMRYVRDTETSKSITASDAPAIILAASGMCESGRVLHHLRATIGDPRSAVVIVGFQAQHTLGRRLVERRDRVRIFGVEHDRRCEIVVLDGFSAHAGQDELVAYATSIAERGHLRMLALVHGETHAQRALASLLSERGLPTPHVPERGERITLNATAGA